ncbi:MAG TPA: hypothetical protein ENK05_14175 [Gammaproteobacteria bacterium]|nr:hypothetical protein [Gammaproteobacteria bacterium]
MQASVQHNCHISDARFAADFTLCVYLLKMREYYRWEKGYGYDEPLTNDAVGDWLTRRETFWESLEDSDFVPLEIDDRRFDPFDSDAINRALEPHGLVYSAGYGNRAKPHFFLARLQQRHEHGSYRIHVSGEEYARDLTAPPAMSLADAIFIRRESLRRMLWERLEEWRWNRPDNAMGRAMGSYDFEGDLEGALDAMTDTEIDTLVLHEIGEVRAGELLGEDWHELLAALPRSRLELMARAVRDHLADALSTLPALLERDHPPSLHFYFANLSGMRRQLYPALSKAYEEWVEYGDTRRLRRQVESGREHWLGLARELLELHRSTGPAAWPRMTERIEHQQL